MTINTTNKIVEFIKRHHFWILLIAGAFLAFWAWWMFMAAVALFGSVPYGKQIFVGIILLWVAAQLWKTAYNAQDTAYYERRFRKTGDDFEHRHDDERIENLQREIYQLQKWLYDDV